MNRNRRERRCSRANRRGLAQGLRLTGLLPSLMPSAPGSRSLRGWSWLQPGPPRVTSPSKAFYGSYSSLTQLWDGANAMPPKPQIADPSTYSRTVLCDRDGKPIIQLSLDDVSINNGKTIKQYKTSSAIRLMDGSFATLSLILSKDRPYAGVCEFCRNPPFIGFRRQGPAHGIVALARAKTCVDCGELCCPRHFRVCCDTKVRCCRCARTYRWRGMLKWLFFTEEEA